MAAGLYLRIFKRQSGGKGKKVSFDGWGEEPPSSLNLAPTKVRSDIDLMVKDYGLKASITEMLSASRICNPVHPVRGLRPQRHGIHSTLHCPEYRGENTGCRKFINSPLGLFGIRVSSRLPQASRKGVIR
jgi:hypothetical protein